MDDADYLVTSPTRDNLVSAAGDTRAATHYTANAAKASGAEVIPIKIDGPFAPYERAKILRAVNEWNVALNSFVRFDIVPQDSDAGTARSNMKPWVIMASHDSPPPSRPALAFTYAIPNAGGLMAVYVDRIGTRDLGGVVMHELGHVLGLGHDSGGGLMAAHYHPTSQQCIDKAAVQAVAARRQLPMNQLNWCETNAEIAAR